MQLLTKEISLKLQKQYHLGSDLDSQIVVCKLFDPCSFWTWYLLNQDPDDYTYLYGIVKGIALEIGSIYLPTLIEYKGPLGIGIERDLYFRPLAAREAWERLLKGEHI